jgi:3-isopropylmalate/(R)-2-methylmalate dehydratase small subunit
VAAKSFARIFFRNAVNIGLPLLECPNIPIVELGTFAEIDVGKGTIKLESGEVFEGTVLPGFILDIILAGGLIPLKQKQYGKHRSVH